MGESPTSPDKRGGVGAELAAHLVVAHGHGDIRVQVHHLAAGRDQRDDHDQHHERQDQGELDHALGGLPGTSPLHHPTWYLNMVPVLFEQRVTTWPPAVLREPFTLTALAARLSA